MLDHLFDRPLTASELDQFLRRSPLAPDSVTLRTYHDSVGRGWRADGRWLLDGRIVTGRGQTLLDALAALVGRLRPGPSSTTGAE